jgi:hypothetical protein
LGLGRKPTKRSLRARPIIFTEIFTLTENHHGNS